MSVDTLRIRYVGVLLLLALLIGGSTVPGMPTTLVIQLCAVPLLLLILPRRDGDPGIPRVLWALMLGSLALVAVQTLPFGLLGLDLAASEAGGAPAPLAISRDIGQTLEVGLFVLIGFIFFVAASRCDTEGLERLVPFFFLGVILNMTTAAAQFAASSGFALSFLPYPATAGIFANPNHFTSLMLASIPFVIYQFAALRRPLMALPFIALIVIVTFAAGSVAGSFLAVGCTAVSCALILRVRPVYRVVLILVAIVGATILAGNPGNVLQVNADSPADRVNIWGNTLNAIGHYLPWGAGFGTFQTVYLQFEPLSDVIHTYANHAHNEFLEIVLEGGLPAGLLLLAYLGLLCLAALRARRRPLGMAAACGILFLMLHSVVDYPLRTTALCLVFALLNAMLFTEAAPRFPAATGVSANPKSRRLHGHNA